MGTGTQEAILTLDEVAAYLRVPAKTLYNWRLRDYGPRAAKVGRHLRYRRSDVDEWLAEQAAAE